MTINIFKLEEYLTHHEFNAPYLLCCSDAESFSMKEIIDLGESRERELWNNLRLGYTEVKGLPVLREQIAQSLYPKLRASQISCFAGAEEGIFCALFSLCGPRDHVIVLTPCYQSFLEIPKINKAEVSTVPLKAENQWRIDLSDIKKAIRANTKCLVINFPHNPTGQVITQQELEELVNLCDEHGIYLLSDEVYRLLGNPKEPWAKPAAELYPRALSLGVMSKAFGLAGLRLGWIACQDESLLKKMEQVKHYTSICNTAPSEIISLIALKNQEKLLARNNHIVATNLGLLDGFFDEHQDLFSWVRPQGGCVGFVDYRSSESVDSFCERLIKQSGVLLMPASIYDHPSNCFRVGFGRKNMPEALSKLEEFLTN